MAIVDALLEFGTDQVKTTGAGNFTFANIIDLGSIGVDTWGSGAQLYPASYSEGEVILNIQSVKLVTTPASCTGNIYYTLIGSDTAVGCTQAAGIKILTSNVIVPEKYKYAGMKLWQISMPRTTYRFLGLVCYSDGNIDIKMNAWVGLDAEYGPQDV